MSLCKEKTERGYLSEKAERRHSHAWHKHQMNRYIRRNEMEMPVNGRFRSFVGWEY